MGVRYLFPSTRSASSSPQQAAAAFFHRSRSRRIAVSALLLFTLISALHAYPNFLVYSNELFGGPSQTYRSVTDPDADWGQGLKWTKTYLDQHPDPNCWFDYHGNPGVNPATSAFHCRPLFTGFEHIGRPRLRSYTLHHHRHRPRQLHRHRRNSLGPG